MPSLKERNQQLIDAVIQKSAVLCPGSLALIGVYGSFMTGDAHEKSDLDLLLVINDDRGRQLACAFLQDDLQVGHDIYCTTWEDLRNDAKYEHPHLSKLMDAQIVYCADETYREKLEQLRGEVRAILSAPLSPRDHAKAEGHLRQAEHHYTMAMVSERRSDVLDGAGGAIYFIESAIAMLNKRYFRYGTKRTYEELNAMERRPEQLCQRIDAVLSADSVAAVKERLTLLMGATEALFRSVGESLAAQGKAADKDLLTGTYEEMYSNFRNKMYLAAESENRHLLFMSLVSAKAMLAEIADRADIDEYDVWAGYDPRDLSQAARAYDRILEAYLKEYKKAGIQVKRFPDIGAFALAYLAEK